MFRHLLLAAGVMAVASNAAMAGGDWRCGAGFVANSPEVEKYIAEKRAAGPAGLTEALELWDFMTASADAEFGKFGGAPTEDTAAAADAEIALSPQETCARLADVVDRVAGQRGAAVSRLFWYTDLDQAQAAAAESGKPILSLRMLGNLTDEYSCANSRFFRTTLYANEEISAHLRDRFVLHWQSVRPVLRVTIDFGDGRKLQRTITGNSAHYVLDSSGRPLDVLPGLYGPQQFAAWLEQCERIHAERASWTGTREIDDKNREALLMIYHQQQRDLLDRRLQEDLQQAAPELTADVAATSTAISESSIAPTKRQVEAPVLAAVVRDYERRAALPNDVWERIAALPAYAVTLDDATRATIRRESGSALTAGAVAITKSIVEDPLVRMVAQFERSLALDGIKNEYLLHRRIHDWFLAGEASDGVDALNERVYAELFLMPPSDPWLGLAPADAYTALEGGGLSTGDAEQSQLGDLR